MRGRRSAWRCRERRNLPFVFVAPAVAVALTPQQKAALLVVTTRRPGIFSGAAGVTFADQEGGAVKALPAAPPYSPARSFTRVPDAVAAGRATARGLRAAGV